MSAEPSTLPGAQPSTRVPVRRRRLRAILIASTVAGLCILAAFVLLRDRSPPPLAKAELADGTILVLHKIGVGEDNSYQVRPAIPPGPALARITGTIFPAWTVTSENRTNVYFSLRDPATGKPVDATSIGYCVLVDRDGWGHRCILVNRQAFQGGRLNFGRRGELLLPDHSNPSRSRFPPLPQADYLHIILVAGFPRLPAQQAKFQVYDVNHQLLGELPVAIPSDPTLPFVPKAQTLPAVADAGDLSLTLEELQLQAIAGLPPGTRRHVVRPKFRLSWQGGDASGWKLPNDPSFDITDAWGNAGNSLDCGLSPISPAWSFKVKVKPNSRAGYREDQAWTTAEFALPEDGELLDLGLEQVVDGVRINVMKIAGSGRHEFSTDAPVAEFHGSNRRSGGKVISSIRRNGNQVDWVLDRDQPALILSHSGVGEYEIAWTFLQDGKQRVSSQLFFDPNVTHQFDIQELRFTDSAAPRGRMQFVVRRAKEFQFTVQPPQINTAH